MGRQFLRFVLFLFSALILGCGGGARTSLESTPLPAKGDGARALDPPREKFQIPRPQLKWTPTSTGSGLAADFLKALKDRGSVALILPVGSMDALMEDRVYQMVRTSAPNTKVVARGKGVLDQLLEERGEIPYRVTLEPGGTDVLGRPYYLPSEHPINTDWLDNKKPLKGAEALLTIRPIRVDDQKLREMRRRRQGGCDEMETALQDALDTGPEFFNSIENASLVTLAESFTRHLEVAVPFWRDELVSAEEDAVPGSLENRCVEAYQVFLKGYEPCLLGPCPIGPKVYATGGGVVGMVDTSQLIPEGCPRDGMRDYRAEIVALGTRAAAEMLSSLNNGWPGEFLRYGGLERIHRSLKQFCAPRHRRLRTEDLSGIREEVESFLERIAVQEISGIWQSAGGLERAPHVGPIHVLARVQVQGTDPVGEAHDIFKKMRRIEHCIGGGEDLFQAALIDVGSSEVHFMGIFFEEELLCDGFKPGFP